MDELLDNLEAKINIKLLERAYHYRLFESKKRTDRIATWIVDHILLDKLL